MSHSSRPNNPGGAVAPAVLNAVMLWVMNQLPVWKPFFLLDSYLDVLSAINMSLIVQIILNLVLVFFHPLFFHHLIQTVFSLVSIIALLWIVRVFPLDFSSRLGDWFNILFRVVPSVWFMPPAGAAVPLPPATLGPMACISRKLPGFSLWPSFWETRAAIGTAETPAEPISGLILPPLKT